MKKYYFETTSSTQDIAQVKVKAVLEGTALKEEFYILSAVQTQGRGRKGSKWHSVKGNFHCTFVFNIEPHEVILTPLIPYITQISIAEALDLYNKKEIKFKWPNDLMINHKKVSGILIDKINSYILIGIGINLLTKLDNNLYTTLKEEKFLNLSFINNYLINPQESLEELANNIAAKIKSYFEVLVTNYNYNRQDVVEKWNKKAYLKSELILFKYESGEVIQGVLKGINNNGALEIIMPENRITEVYSGRLVM